MHDDAGAVFDRLDEHGLAEREREVARQERARAAEAHQKAEDELRDDE
jgi:hypothetical protein